MQTRATEPGWTYRGSGHQGELDRAGPARADRQAPGGVRGLGSCLAGRRRRDLAVGPGSAPLHRPDTGIARGPDDRRGGCCGHHYCARRPRRQRCRRLDCAATVHLPAVLSRWVYRDVHSRGRHRSRRREPSRTRCLRRGRALLLAAVVIAASSALNLDWSVFGLGVWLLAVAAGSGFAGPVGVWAVSALAGGAALLLMAATGLRRRSRE